MIAPHHPLTAPPISDYRERGEREAYRDERPADREPIRYRDREPIREARERAETTPPIRDTRERGETGYLCIPHRRTVRTSTVRKINVSTASPIRITTSSPANTFGVNFSVFR